jgi:hypothetical protein
VVEPSKIEPLRRDEEFVKRVRFKLWTERNLASLSKRAAAEP